MLIAASISVFFAFWVFLYWIFNVLFVKERFIERLEDLDPTTRVVEKAPLVQKKKRTLMYSVAKLLPKRKNNRTAELLIRANLAITAEELFIYKLLFSIAFGFLAYSIRQDIILVLIIVAIIWFVPTLIIKNKVKKRLDDFNEQLNGALGLISNALKAGHSFLQALGIAARETQGAFSEEFKVLLKELNFGLPMEVAFENLLNRVDSSDMKLVVNAIMIQKEIGGNLSEILENISSTIRERQVIKNEMKTLTAQGRMSGIIIMLLPVFLGGIIYVMNREYMMVLFTTNIGLGMLALAGVNEFIGMLFIRKIITIEV